MDPVHPWLDPIEVRRMAERLLQPVQQPAVQVADAGFGEQFVGYSAPGTDTAPLVAAEPVPVPVSPVLAASSPVTVPPPVEVIAPKSEVRGPFLDRVSRFRDWLRHHFQATGVFLLDREGAVIFDESGHGKLHFLARSLALASRRPGGAPSNVHVKVGATATLEVIPVDTPYGCIVLGAVVPVPLDPADVATVMDGLRSVASPQNA